MDWHTQHAPLGAFASFTLGRHGATGGFGQSLGGPARQSLFIGWRRGTGAWRLLPFYPPTPAPTGEAAYTGEVLDVTKIAVTKPTPVGAPELSRELGWASDTWRAGPLRFTLYTPFGPVDDPARLDPPAARFAFAPVVCAELTGDATRGDEDLELVFGLSDPAQPTRVLGDTALELAGFAQKGTWGFATPAAERPELRQAFDLLDPKFRDHRGLHLLGAESGLIFRVPAGTVRTIPLALAFYHAGPATTGLPTRYYYTRLFADVEAVLRHGLECHDRYVALATVRDRELDASGLSPDQRWLLAQATHSYLGSTQLLELRGQPLWVVNEGEYRMLNTFDLTVDHLFFELRWFPWAVRNVLDQFSRRYRYTDAHGISFTHDMGVCDQFTPPGRSSYECDRLHGCFSHMTMEQLVNWVCTAVTYAEHTGDDAWLRRQRATLRACARSLRTRDAAREADRDGLLKRDSDRCAGGAEITTYDSLDTSLGQARNNLYLAGKTFAAWLLLERAFGRLGLAAEARAASATADRLAATLLARFERDTGMFPAVFEAGNRSRILPAVEGLVFPLFLGDAAALRTRYPELMAAYESHLTRALQPGVCLTSAGGWQLSSTSNNTWMSKIFLAQHVVRRLFPRAAGPLAARGDAEHVRWQQGPAIAPFAFTDQIRTTDGGDIGSRYYPRGVTAILWLDERAAPAGQ
jgi:hypothetical protein